MRMLMEVVIPEEPFNTLLRDGKIEEKMGKVLDATKPEAVYFTERDGHRGALLVVDVPNPSSIPGLAEPWFLGFNATCKLRIAMTPEDLKNSNLASSGRMW